MGVMKRPVKMRWYLPGVGMACGAVLMGLSRLGTAGAYIALVICAVLGGYLLWAMATRWNRHD